jgi:alcohol dehydrogenase, propanol-preferring
MRAQVLQTTRPVEQDPLRAADLPLPEPGAGELLIRVRACGICRTDLHIAEGEVAAPRLPIVPGHQVVGVVERLGAGCTRFRPGDRVGVGWLNSVCGTCRFCRDGLENLCERGRFTGFHADGGYAEAMVAPEAFVCALAEFPSSESDAALAPLLCAGLIGYRALRLCGAARGDRLAFFGFGGSAHVTLQVARHLGCEVYVFTRGEAHRRLALDLGAAWAGNAGDAVPGLADRAILFAPAGRLIAAALRVLRRGGTLAIAAIHLDTIPEMDYQLLFQERVIRSVTSTTRKDAEEFLSIAARASIRTEVETFDLEDANLALLRLKQGKIRGAAALLTG